MFHRFHLKNALVALFVLAASAFVAVASAGAAVSTGFEAADEHDAIAISASHGSGVPALLAEAASTTVSIAASSLSSPRLDAVRYRPRTYRRDNYRGSSSSYSSPVQIHAGFFEPEGKGSTSFVLGLRGGPQVDPHVQIGGGLDWHHKSEKARTVTGDPYSQGGTTIFPERVLSRASVDLLPMYGFIQVGGTDDAPVIPYGGASVGYQVLFLNADDYTTGEKYDATFGGFMWEAWGGVAVPLSGQSRFSGEVFVHQGDAEREVDDIFGTTYRERVNLDGVGMRFGLSWGF